MKTSGPVPSPFDDAISEIDFTTKMATASVAINYSLRKGRKTFALLFLPSIVFLVTAIANFDRHYYQDGGHVEEDGDEVTDDDSVAGDSDGRIDLLLVIIALACTVITGTIFGVRRFIIERGLHADLKQIFEEWEEIGVRVTWCGAKPPVDQAGTSKGHAAEPAALNIYVSDEAKWEKARSGAKGAGVDAENAL